MPSVPNSWRMALILCALYAVCAEAGVDLDGEVGAFASVAP